MTRPLQLLVCDDDPAFQLAIQQSLKGRCSCRVARDSDEALAIVRQAEVGIVLLDIEMRTRDEGLRAIPLLLGSDPGLSIVMSSGRADFASVREAMRLGAVDYVVKGADPDELWHVLSRVHERRGLTQRSAQQDFEARAQQRLHRLVGESAAIRALRRTIDKVRASDANVVIHGETGTGKEVVARQLRKTAHDGSLAPFVAVDSSTIQSATAESQLFGHEKGAFTGADRQAQGIFEEADGGVVYFDEISNMPLEIQAKLLRVIQEKELARMGSSKVIRCEFRVICATNRDLEAMARERQFKEDLLQRLNVLPIEVPSLRERAEDIPLLIEHLLSKQGARLRFTPDALRALQLYAWPGNVRELGNVVAYLSAMAESDEIGVEDLPPKIRASAPLALPDAAPGGSFYERVSGFERELLEAEYRRHEGRISQMALALGMDRSHLYTKLKEHGIHAPRK